MATPREDSIGVCDSSSGLMGATWSRVKKNQDEVSTSRSVVGEYLYMNTMLDARSS